ncbi:tudor domain-containing protein 15 [Chanos chanos]|uniref:Tudor domain-containing protein 15 n=1 Tax=Chanos chanos TaxID=29144 RepID=A0A6J2V4D7_CHACN|nr:tudor domain-containing protein 15-like [Chanos chanos]
MLSTLAGEVQRPQEGSDLPAPCALWPVDVILTHVDCGQDDILVRFQGQYSTICELDYNILQVEIQNAQKTAVSSLEVGEMCLVEDFLSSHWYRGRVKNKEKNLFNVLLLDYGNVLTVCAAHLASASDELLMLPPKIICGFFANVLPVGESWNALSAKYFSSLIGSKIKGYIHALLPHKVLILEVPDINRDLLRFSFGRHADTDTFLLLVEMLMKVPIKKSDESVPDLLIERQFSQELCFKSSGLQGFENVLSFCGPKLIAGTKEKVRITAAVNLSSFYCQSTRVAKDLKEMSEKLAIACESGSPDSSCKPTGNLGLLCAVRGKDEKWHRGFVQYLAANSQARVIFVDYGYCEAVKVENVLPLPSDYLSIPIMAFQCSMSCLREQDETIRNHQLEILKSGLLGGVLEVSIDDFDKEQNLYYVTLHINEHCEHLKSGQTQEFSEPQRFYAMENEETFSQSYYHMQKTNETRRIQTSGKAVHPQTVIVNSIFEGYVEHVQNPSDFWLRTADRNLSFEDLLNRMTKYYNELPLAEEVLENPVPGTLCAAMYEKDMHYYRAVVKDTLESGAEVFFIDFGNTEKVPSMVIKKLPQKFTAEPGFAINCSLAHTVPVEDVWTGAATDYFRQVTSDTALLVHVVHQKNDRHLVELYLKGTSDCESVSMLMEAANMAEFWRYTPTKAGAGRSQVQKKSHRHKGRPVDKSIRNVHCQNVSRQECSRVPEKVKNLDNEASNQKLFHENGIFTPQKYWPGNELRVRCSYVNSPSDFWCQNENQMSALDKLMEDMQNFYQTHIDLSQSHREVCCAVKSPNDNRWYRGCALGAKNGKIEVILVDYGMVVEVKMENVQALLPEFFKLEGQAFRCSLCNLIRPSNGNAWSEEACHLFRDFTTQNSLSLTCSIHSQIYVKHIGLLHIVDIHSEFQRATTNLVEKGLAVEIQSMNHLLPVVYPCSFVYSSFNISVGSEERVLVTHVSSPWEMYFQLDRNAEIIDNLMDQVTKHSADLVKAGSCLEVGNICLAKYFGDGMWYRGFAQSVQSDLHLSIFFVDYGNKQVSEKSSVLPIPRQALDLQMVPMQALKCILADIPKGDSWPEINAWLEKAVCNKLLQAKFVAKENDGSFVCDLFDGNIHINEKVKELIAAQDHSDNIVNTNSADNPHVILDTSRVSRTGKAKRRKHLKAGMVSGPCKTKSEIKHSLLKSPQIHLCNKDTKSGLSHACQPVKQTEEKSNFKSLLSNGNIEKQRDAPHSSKLETPTVAFPKLSDLPDVKIYPGFSVVGFVSHFNSVNSFFVQMEDDEHAILKMGEKLNSELLRGDIENVGKRLKVGDLVVAEYEEDSALYRAVVKDVAASGLLTVEYVDFGNTATVDKERIHQLPTSFLSQPRLSVPCTLTGTQSFEGDMPFTDKPILVEFLKCLRATWEVSIKVPESSSAHVGPEKCDHSERKVLQPHSIRSQNLHRTDSITQNELVTDSRDPVTCEENLNLKEFESNRQVVIKLDGDTCLVKSRSEDIQGALPKSTTTKQIQRLPAQLQQHKTKKSCKLAAHKKLQFRQSNETNALKAKPPDKVIVPKFMIPEMTSHEKTLYVISRSNAGTSAELTQNVGFSQLCIRERETEAGMLLSVLDDGELYIRLDKVAGRVADLEQIISKTVVRCKVIPKQNVKEGLECLAKSAETNQWARAAVCCVIPDKEKCTVLFVDFGTKEMISVKCIKEIDGSLKQIPVLAVHCKWNGFRNSNREAKTMLKDTLRSVVGQNIKVMFVSYSESSHLWNIEIMMNEPFLIQQHGSLSVQHAEEKPSHLLGSNVCPGTSKAVFCSEKESHAPRLFLAPVKMDLEYSGFAAAVTTPGEFYIVLEDLLLVMNTVSNILEELSDVLDPLPQTQLRPSSGCLVKFEEKKKWCRAEIVHLDVTSVVINLVDYGHYAHVPCKDVCQLKRLPEELASLPKLTYPCLLRGIKPLEEGSWSDDAIIFFQKCIYQKQLQIYFRQPVSEGKWEVDVLAGGMNPAKELVDAGHASYIDSMLGLRFRQVLESKGMPQQSTASNSMEVKPEGSPRHLELKDMEQSVKKMDLGISKVESAPGNQLKVTRCKCYISVIYVSTSSCNGDSELVKMVLSEVGFEPTPPGETTT